MILIVSLEDKRAALGFYQSGRAIQTNGRALVNGLDKLLKRKKKTPADISGILVFFGQLGFSASRQAAAVFNTLAFARKIKIAALHGKASEAMINKGIKMLAKRRAGQYIQPRYDHPPHITQPQKKI